MMTATPSLFQLAEVACAKRPFVAVERPANDDDDMSEPTLKKVRFVGVEMTQDSDNEEPSTTARSTSPPQKLERLMEKVRRRAERRNQRHSLRSPPPPPECVADGETRSNLDLTAMQRKLQKMEQLIKDTARAELDLMNRAKRMQEKRAIMTRKYESSAQQLREMQQSQQQAQIFQMGVLPPLMIRQAIRRVSKDQFVVNLTEM
uniref:Uncharacterized protein n=1 Tax=Amphora coffeiformis TaxID=265554 RepID=A0A7S3L4A3_9STRA